MSDQRSVRWRSGRLSRSSLRDLWQPPRTYDAADPQIPSLPIGADAAIPLTTAQYTFGTHAEAIAQSSSWVVYFTSQAIFSIVVATAPPNAPAHYAAAPQEQTQVQPIFERVFHAPAVVPPHLVRAAPQEEAPQQQPIFSGIEPPPPRDTGEPYRAAPQDSGELLQPWWSKQAPPTFFTPQNWWTAVSQESPELLQPLWERQGPPTFYAPQKWFTAAQQESPELLQPIFSGQQPPPPLVVALRATTTVALDDQQQPQPTYERAYYAPADLAGFKPTLVGAQESGEQPQPEFSGQTPPTFFAATIKQRIEAAPQDEANTQQVQPIFSGTEPPTSFEPSARVFFIEEREWPEQPQPTVLRAVFAAAVVEDVPLRYFVAAPQQDAEQLPPVLWRSFAPAQPELASALFTFGAHAAELAQANQSAQFWRAPPSTFVFDLAGLRPYFARAEDDSWQRAPQFWHTTPPTFFEPTVRRLDAAPQDEAHAQQLQPTFEHAPPPTRFEPSKHYSARPQDSPELLQPIFSGTEPPTQFEPIKSCSAGQQESGEQPQPIFSGQQPLLSPALGPTRVAAPADSEAIAGASESAAFWGGRATLHVAAVQYDLPPGKRLSVGPQESGEQSRPVVVGQQPLPSPQPGSTRLAGPIDAEQTAVQYGTFWLGDATLYVAVTQDIPAKHALIVLEQETTEQVQPQFAHPRIASADITSRFIWQSGDLEGRSQSQSASFWRGQFIADVVQDAVVIRPLLTVAEQAYQFQPQPQFNREYFIDSVVVVPPVVVTGGGGDRGVNLFREEKPKLAPASFAVRFEQTRQTFSARFEAASELRIRWVAAPVLDEFRAELEASSEFKFRSSQDSSFALSFVVLGSQQKQVPVKASHQPMRIGVEFVTPDSELHIRFEVEE